MIQLLIKDTVVDLDEKTDLKISYEGNNIGTLSDRNGNFAKQFDLPMTAKNRALFGFADQLSSAVNPTTLLPCKVYYTNWLLFQGMAKVVRYFGNKIQIELIGGLGTLVEAIGQKKLSDFEYPRLPTSTVNDGGYDDITLFGYVNAGLGLGRSFRDGYAVLYSEETPKWYKLADILLDIADGLGITLTLPESFAYEGDLYLQQGRWGANKELANGVFGGPATNMIFPPMIIVQTNRRFASISVEINSTTTPLASDASDALKTNSSLGGALVKVTWAMASYLVSSYSTSKVVLEAYYGDLLVLWEEVAFPFNYVGQLADITRSFEVAIAMPRTMDFQDIRFRVRIENRTDVPQYGNTGLYNIYNSFTLEVIDRQVSDTIQRPQYVLPDIAVSDLLLDLAQRLGYLIDYNDLTKELTFNRLDLLGDRSQAYNWDEKVNTELTGQFLGQYDSSFVFGNYAKANIYKSENGLDIGTLVAGGAIADTTDAYTSVFNIPTLVFNIPTSGLVVKTGGLTGGEKIKSLINGAYYNTGDLVHYKGNWWECKENYVLTNTSNVPGAYTVISSVQNGLSYQSNWKLVPATSAFGTEDVSFIAVRRPQDNTFYLANEVSGFESQPNYINFNFFDTGLNWQTAINEKYQWLTAILTKQRVHKVLVRMRVTDFPFDFNKLVYYQGAYWYVVSIADFNPMDDDTCVATLAYVPDYTP